MPSPPILTLPLNRTPLSGTLPHPCPSPEVIILPKVSANSYCTYLLLINFTPTFSTLHTLYLCRSQYYCQPCTGTRLHFTLNRNSSPPFIPATSPHSLLPAFTPLGTTIWHLPLRRCADSHEASSH
jgi:hypothetical protein